MPFLVVGIPAAIALAWLALKGRFPRRGDFAGVVPTTAGEPLAPGETEQLRPDDEDDPYKRDELPFDRPSASGGEYGGPYGPSSGAGGEGEGEGASSPSPTQTSTLIGYALAQKAFAATTPYYGAEVGVSASGPTQTYQGGALGAGPTRSGATTVSTGSIIAGAPAPAPAPTPTPTYLGGRAM